MHFLLKSLFLLIALSLAAVVGAYLLVSDANNLKPQLETLLSEQSGMHVTLGGDVRWVLLPPVELAMQEVGATQDGQQIAVESLRLKVDFSAIWQDVNKWRVDALTLSNASVTRGDQVTQIESLELSDFALATAAPIAIQGSYKSAGEATALPFAVDGMLTYTPESETYRQAIQLSQADVTADTAQGRCEIDVKDNPRSHPSLPAETPDDILPLATLMQYDIVAECNWQTVTLAEEKFTDVQTTLTNIGDALNLYVEVPAFFSGQLISEVDVDLHARPIHWHVRPELNEVDSQKLLDWRQQSVQWAALFALHGELTMTGNTPDAFYRSVRADTELDGGQGTINIARLKQQLLTIAALTRQDTSIAAWPDVWQYQEMLGNWRTRGQQQTFDFVLDHLTIDGGGETDYANGTSDIRANITFGPAPADNPYQVNDYLVDVPIPFRCRGETVDLDCQLDDKAAQKIVARALTGSKDTGLRRKLEEKIEEEVPEEYRDAARNLLDILGRALEQ